MGEPSLETVSANSTKERFRLSSVLISFISFSQMGLFSFLVPLLFTTTCLFSLIFSKPFLSYHKFFNIHLVSMIISSISLFFLDKETENPIPTTS